MINKIYLLGRLGKDVEVQTLNSGSIIGKFTIATSENYKDKDGNKKEQTEWHNCVLWGSRAEKLAQFVKKGDLLHVEGKVTHRSYEDKEGNIRYVTEVVVRDFSFLPRQTQVQKKANPQDMTFAEADDDNSLPF